MTKDEGLKTFRFDCPICGDPIFKTATSRNEPSVPSFNSMKSIQGKRTGELIRYMKCNKCGELFGEIVFRTNLWKEVDN